MPSWTAVRVESAYKSHIRYRFGFRRKIHQNPAKGFNGRNRANISIMRWNWQKCDWPNWQFDLKEFADREARFLLNSGELSGAWSHLTEDDRLNVAVEIITDEAMKTFEIEGEYLDRASAESSVRLAFGLSAERRRGLAESGIADLPMDGFGTWRSGLDEENLFRWHNMVCRGRTDLRRPGILASRILSYARRVRAYP